MLSADQLARAAAVTVEYVHRLVEVGAIHADAAGLHAAADISRVRLAGALAAGGIDDAGLMWAVEKEILQLDQFANLWGVGESSGRTYAEFQSSLGQRGEILPSVYAAFGIGAPPPDTPTTVEEERIVTGFIELWASIDGGTDAPVRAARIAGEGIRRLQLGTLDLFDEFGGSPPARQRQGMSADEANRPSFVLSGLMPSLLVWLLERHLQSEIFDRVVRFLQGSLAREGRIAPPPAEEPAIVFVDLSGYTELTARIGDAGAAESAAALEAMAQVAAARHRGRVVKLLGDGVMLRYDTSTDAVRSALELMSAALDAGLPPAHAGIAAGPLVVRDGDVYGNTVNLASRVAALASSGELLVDSAVAERLADAGIGHDEIGLVKVKGIGGPVRLARVRR